MRTASKLLILLCLMSKEAKGSLQYSSLEEAIHALRTTMLDSEDCSHSEKLLNLKEVLNSEEFSYYEKSNSEELSNSKEFSYYEKSNSEGSSNSEEFLYYEKSNSDEASNLSEEVYQDIQTSRGKNASSGDTYRAGFGPSNRKEIVKATSNVPLVHIRVSIKTRFKILSHSITVT